MKKLLLAILFSSCLIGAKAQLLSEKKESNTFDLTVATAIYVDPSEETLVKKSAVFLQQDIEAVTGKRLPLIHSADHAATNIILIGTIARSSLLKKITAANKIKAALQGKWETYYLQTLIKPLRGIENMLLIIGSDRRGTAYGVFELSRQIGVSPWHWWADVPIQKKEELFIKKQQIIRDAPRIKYRGIFINDEAPALSNWSREKFGGFNHAFYEKVFELMLRLKANYLWPAMWGNAFYDDDTLNLKAAEDYGIVIGTSHHEPLMRAHDEWRRYGSGKWNYDSNAAGLQDFWRKGLDRATNEKIVSIGMRGDGDEPMTRETATALLEKIVKDQRKIIEEVTRQPASRTPQLWALYKEVQAYYDKGMRVPDDVTLLLCDDNWGNIRKLPRLNEKKRKGGYGIYYHFDYVGGPRNYKWLNTNNLSRVWEQMHLAYQYGVDRIWIVNVGDIKPMELPISFFLDYAWNPDSWNEDNLLNYYTNWAAEQFGSTHAVAIGDILRRYSQYSARRKPELLDAKTYAVSLIAEEDEAARVCQEWNKLYNDAKIVNAALPSFYTDAFYQLVLHPVKAMSNLHELYRLVAWNRLYDSLRSPQANEKAQQAKQRFEEDSLIQVEYHSLKNGKWSHMMSQTHIGYTYWQQPPFNKMPEVRYVAAGAQASVAREQVRFSAEDSIPASVKYPAFYELNGTVSMEAEHWSRAKNTPAIKWKVIPGIGRTGSGITTFPVTASTMLTTEGPQVEYEFYTYSKGKATVSLYFSPTLNFHQNEGLQLAISIDDEKPTIITLNKDDSNQRIWETWVASNIIIKKTEHTFQRPGRHVLKYRMISPAVILQKIVVDMGGNAASYYLGPQETKK